MAMLLKDYGLAVYPVCVYGVTLVMSASEHQDSSDSSA